MSAPLVSIAVPFYNNADTIERALQCILRQTVADTEVLAIDDGSGDDGFRRAESVHDPRIRLLRNERNRGVAATRNRALDLARGEFIAFLDADDTCPPRRLEWTLDAMRRHPDIGICGGWMRVYRQGRRPYILRQPCRPVSVHAMRLFGNPFCCASILLRRAPLLRHGIRYREELQTGEDHDLCSRLLQHAQGLNVPRALYDYRWNPNGLTANAGAKSARQRAAQCRPHLESLLTAAPSPEELLFHAQIGNGAGAANATDLVRRRDWLQTLLENNRKRALFDESGLAECAALVWFRVCRNSSHLGLSAWRIWRTAPFVGYGQTHPDEWLGFIGSLIKCRIARGPTRPQGELPS